MENSQYLNDVEARFHVIFTLLPRHFYVASTSFLRCFHVIFTLLPRHFYNASTSYRETVYYVPKGNIIIIASNDNEYEGNTI